MAQLELEAADGHSLDSYVAIPEGEPIGALVVVQEIFGVNASIRAVADAYANDGFIAIAPALFDRFGKDIVLSYGGDDLKQAFDLYGKLEPAKALIDVAAAFHKAKEYSKSASFGVGVLGFCYGGLMSWLAATRGSELEMHPACTVGYYAGGVGKVATEQPTCPVMLHFGGADSHIGPEQIEAVRSSHPQVTIHLYEGAEHAFANPNRTAFKADAAELARKRSLAFLKEHVG